MLTSVYYYVITHVSLLIIISLFVLVVQFNNHTARHRNLALGIKP